MRDASAPEPCAGGGPRAASERQRAGARLACLLAAAAAACDAAKVPVAGCATDGECAGALCVSGRCLPRVAPEATFSLEVRPRVESAFAPQQFPAITFPAQGVELRVGGRVRVQGSVFVDGAPLGSGTAQVIVSVPSAIPGGADLRFEAAAAGPAGLLTYQLELPQHLLGRSDGKAQIVPGSPLSQTTPPWVSAIPLSEMLPVLSPPQGDELLVISGQLRERVEGEPLPAYVARALVGGIVVSNRAPVDRTTGAFRLHVPKTLTPRGTLEGVSVELVGAETAAPLPRLVIEPVAAALPPTRLPPFRQALPFELSVVSKAISGEPNPIADASLFFRTPLPEAEGATAFFEQQARSDAFGRVRVMLIPGSGNANQEYWIAVAPLPNAPFSSVCLKRAVGSRPTGEAPILAAIELAPSIALPGIVRRWDRTPEGDVSVRAVRVDEGWRQACEIELRPRDVTATTKADGRFTLQLEPGRYQLIYAPIQGSASPPAVEDETIASPPTETPMAAAVREVRLPPAAVAEGRLLAPDGTAVRDSEVACFLPAAPGRRPASVSARTDALGRFRLVVPR